ncbi:exonuclease domain-containing protein [Gordonia sp. NPDC062954]|uniref:exonuclease domain-containing protein n=1 Tax=Gordonia sp. NPDC062954 TaxID=3364003 RepID=UPI0037CBDB12
MHTAPGWYPDPWQQAQFRWFDGSGWTATVSSAPGWYPDPWQQAAWRWFDGSQWTATVHPAEQRAPVNPTPVGPSTPSPAGDLPTDPGLTSPTCESDRSPSGGLAIPEQTGITPQDLSEASTLAGLIGTGSTVAVIDVETTGLRHSDRIVEIAIVTVDHRGVICDEFETLVNPQRDAGPVWIHGLTASMLVDAPSFADIAGAVATRLDGAVVVGHNISFDTRMVGYELTRAGIDIDWGSGLDTLSVTRRKLAAACAAHSITLDNAHRAIADARATAELLLRVADQFPAAGTPARTGVREAAPTRLQVRDKAAAVYQPSPYLVELARDIRPAADVASYVVLLDRALADLKLTDDERTELRELAGELGLTDRDIERAHREFLTSLVDTALDDGVVTDDELDSLVRVAALLDLDTHLVISRTNSYRIATESLQLDADLTVCFTGDGASRADGTEVTREELHAIAARHGLRPVDSVTAKGCQLLVAVDAATLSGKAKSAHKFRIPIATVDDFLAATSAGRPLPVGVLDHHGVACVCERCGDSWTASRRGRVCRECRRSPAGAATRRAKSTPVPTPESSVDTLVCAECSRTWHRGRTRGRRPHRCPECAGAA